MGAASSTPKESSNGFSDSQKEAYNLGVEARLKVGFKDGYRDGHKDGIYQGYTAGYTNSTSSQVSSSDSIAHPNDPQIGYNPLDDFAPWRPVYATEYVPPYAQQGSELFKSYKPTTFQQAWAPYEREYERRDRGEKDREMLEKKPVRTWFS